MATEVLIMPFPAAWARGLINESYNDHGFTDVEISACQIMIEQMRHDGYKVVGLASAEPPLTTTACAAAMPTPAWFSPASSTAANPSPRKGTCFDQDQIPRLVQ